MECCRMSELEKYLKRFDEILCQMENKMLNRNSISDITLDFIECMIPHHEGAISMCENLLKYCIDPRLKSVADSIIKEQSQGINQLKEVQRMICN